MGWEFYGYNQGEDGLELWSMRLGEEFGAVGIGTRAYNGKK
jgi:hypothetical protein